MSRFRNISFGYSSAETERNTEPRLITEGYVDFKNASVEALSGAKFLFLGYKGAGKSSIAEKIELTLDGDFSSFVKIVSLADFPFTPFSKIIRGDAEPETKFPLAWSWILLIYILESFSKDHGKSHPQINVLEDSVRAFREMGVSPNAEPSGIVRTTAKNSFKLSLPGELAQYSWSGSEVKSAAQIPDFVASLKELVRHVRSDSRHYLLIDGLDDVLTTREVQYKSLSALIFEVGRLNAEFSRNHVPAKIVLLCRTDLFERIPGANKNKIRQDSAVELDWYHDPQEPDNSLLMKIAQLRAGLSLGEGVSLFDDLFPKYIDNSEVKKALLDMTRHTPRDFLRLLTHIQEFASEEKVTKQAIRSGMREYSIKYFLPEIQDELSGYATPDEIARMITAFGRLRKRDFGFDELVLSAEALPTPLGKDRVGEIADALFQCSALGNIQHRTKSTHYTFKYRNRHSSFNDGEKIMLHRGLWKALNLV